MKIFVLILLSNILLLAKTIDPNNEETPEAELYEQRMVEESDLKETIKSTENPTISKTISATGKNSLDGLDISIVENLKKYNSDSKNSFSSQGNAIAERLKTKVGAFDSSDISTHSQDTIISKDNNEAKALKTMNDFYTMTRSLYANNKSIKCYVTRKLVNSYYCPLPSLSNSFFVGGSYNDDKEDRKKHCDGLCQEESTCVPMDLNKKKEVESQLALTVSEKAEIIYDTDSAMQVKKLEFVIGLRYKYTNSVDIDSVDYDKELELKEIQKNQIAVRFDVYFYNSETSEFEINISQKEIKLSEFENIERFYLNGFKTSKMKVVFFAPYIKAKDGEETKIVDFERFIIKVDSKKVEYSDNKLWFCAEENFVTNSQDCDGVTKQVVIGSSARTVCVTEANKQRESEYGAYYTEGSCNSTCRVREECVPTYKHLTNYSPGSIPDSVKDIKIGCVSDPDNTSCTDEMCMKYFIDDTLPISESTWINDDEIKKTVDQGIVKEGTVRPRISIERGLGSNGSIKEKAKVSLSEMTETSYTNMINSGTYNISKNTIAQNINASSGFYKNKSGGIKWKVRVNSFDVDNDMNYYFYTVIEADSTFTPLFGSYDTQFGIQSGSTDNGIKIKDRTLLTNMTNGLKVIHKTENIEGYFKKLTCVTDSLGVESCTSQYLWNVLSDHNNSKYVTFVNSVESSYDKSNFADYISMKKVSSASKWEVFSLFGTSQELINTDGLLFKTQSSRNRGGAFARVYSGAKAVLEKSSYSSMRIYGMYSPNKLTYEELVTKYKTHGMKVYDSNEKTSDEVKHDGEYNTENVKFYISGKPDKMSVNIDFTPSINEEGKKTFVFMLLYEDL